MGNIPNYDVKQITGPLIDKYRKRKTGGGRVQWNCNTCGKPIEIKPWVSRRKDEVSFMIRKGWKEWHFCSYKCQKEFRDA